LEFIAFFRAQKGGLRRSLDALSNDFKSKIVRHHNDRAHDRDVCGRVFVGDLADKGLIDLETRERITREIAE